MLLLIEIVVIVVLIAALAALFIEESEIKKSRVPQGMVKEYWDGEERRTAIRVTVDLAVRYSIEKKVRLKVNSEIKNLSTKGLQLAVNEKLSTGTIVFMQFDIPESGDMVSVNGKVVWTNGEFGERDASGRRVFRTGVRFIDIEPESDALLIKYITKMSGI